MTEPSALLSAEASASELVIGLLPDQFRRVGCRLLARPGARNTVANHGHGLADLIAASVQIIAIRHYAATSQYRSNG